MYSRQFLRLKKPSTLLKCTRYSLMTHSFRKIYQFSRQPHKLLNQKSPYANLLKIQARNYTLVFRAIRGVLKLRYLVLGSALGGGYKASQKYEEFKNNLPNFPDIPSIEWMEQYLKEVGVDGQTKERIMNKYQELRESTSDSQWLKNISKKLVNKVELINEWIEEAKQAQIADSAPQEESSDLHDAVNSIKSKLTSFNMRSKESAENVGDKEINNDLHEKLIKTQLKYQKANERLERENRELKHQLLLLKQQKGELKKSRGVRKPLIDMYSDVLDEITNFDSTLSTKDFLPRVVVVGDQSAGKTSVLEMIAGARIFPRGSGEMMTRSPVKVTLSEGPYQIAKFSDMAREFDLTNAQDLQDLRNEIEKRMKYCMKRGESVSKEVISLSVQGPGLQRMVLVDLPGIISTVTTEMSADTKEAINEITNHYMNNPNAIILCIQDGSIDVEKSLVTDLVSRVDPNGKRTIFVLTKLDLAETNLANPTRIKKILDGKLFPMKALGYFGVVTGKGVKNESIESIKEYEEKYFKGSKLIKNNLLNISQCTTQNLSLAVSDCFWKMVKASVVQQADSFKALRFNLEAEWRSKFSHCREMCRGDLLEKAKSEILDQVAKLSCLNTNYWDNVLYKRFWSHFFIDLFENVYFSSHSVDEEQMKTLIEISLAEWVKTLPTISVQIAKDVLITEFKNLLFDRSQKDYDDIYDEIKQYVLEELVGTNKYEWETRALNSLKVLQSNVIENDSISSSSDWNAAVKCVEKLFQEKLNDLDEQIHALTGPGILERWRSWKHLSEANQTNFYIQRELEKLLKSHEFSTRLDRADIELIQANLKLNGIQVTEKQVEAVWAPLMRKHLITQSCKNIGECKKAFYYYQQGYKDINCDELVTFWRIESTIASTVSALRNQLMNRESKRLEREIKEILDVSSANEELKIKLFKNKRAILAENLRRVRQIQEQLDEFIEALNQE